MNQSNYPKERPGKCRHVRRAQGKEHSVPIMPYSEEFHDVWKGGIKRAAASTGLEPIRIHMINQSSEVTDDIVAHRPSGQRLSS